jgi:UDPglucose 6-dehydrogenase
LIDQAFPAPAFLPRPAGAAPVPVVTTDAMSAEMIKYAANAFLALKISFINEVGTLASKIGANIQTVAQGIGMDPRIGPRFLQAGLGWGGSCFGKDTSALLTTAFEHGVSMPIIRSAREVNGRMRVQVIEKLRGVYESLEGKRISLLGLSFKPETDDLRDAPVLEIIRRLADHGAHVTVHDPQAMECFRRDYPEQPVAIADSAEALFDDADAVVLITEWREYLALDWAALRARMQGAVVVDGRNALDRTALEAAGYTYLRIP